MDTKSSIWKGLLGFLILVALPLVAFHYILAHNVYARDAQNPRATQHGWTHVSTASGSLSPPSTNTQQVLSLIADIDNDGINDFVIGSRGGAGPSLVWYQRQTTGWTQYPIETQSLPLEAGGAFHDIDDDGDLDIVAGSNAQDNEIWWWENPSPNFSPGDEWVRRYIKNSGSDKHHDMMFGEFDDDPGTEFVYWNQHARALFIVDIPAAVKTTEPWPQGDVVFNTPDNKREGLTQADVDGDGKNDIIGGGYWFKHNNNSSFTPQPIEAGLFLRVAAGQLIPGGRPEIVQVPGDRDGMGRWFEWNGTAWIGRDLPVGEIKHGHSLDLADVDGDGNLDIFVGEMRFHDGHNNANPNARMMVLFGDGLGNFIGDTLATGFGHHESRLGDLDGDGDFDILGKPYTWDTPRLDVWLNGGDQPDCISSLASWKTHVIDNARPYRAVFINAADLDGDGFKDIVTGAWWYRNPGSPGGVWQRNEIGPPLNQMATVTDFDGDGDIDVLGTKLENGASSDQYHRGSAFVWARNNGAGGFAIFDNLDAGTGDFLQGIVIKDFFGAGREAILSWHNQDTKLQSLGIPSNPATGQWPIDTAMTLSQSEDLSAGDIDRDGDDDLLLGTIWLENDEGNWVGHTLHSTTNKPDRNRLADVNGDGRLDAVVGYETNSQPIELAWYEAPIDPAQLWSEHVITRIIAPMSLDVGDMDGDGDVDIVAGEHHKANPSQGRIFAFENDGAEFRQHLIATGDEHHDGAQLVDIDNDGDPDVISIGWTHDRVLVYEQSGCQPDPGPTNTPNPEATPTQTPTATTTPTPAATPAATITPGPGGDNSFIYLSSTSGGKVNGITFADEDIMRFDSASAAWSTFFDGSDTGLAETDIDAFHLRGDGALLLSLDAEQNVPGLGLIDDSDVLLFTPTFLGPNTAGEFSLYLDGSDVGLSTNAEDITALSETVDGRLIIGTKSNVKVLGVSALKWDLILFTPAASGLGPDSAGTWSLYLRGQAIGLSAKSEAITGVSLLGDDHIGVTTKGTFQVGTINGSAADVFNCHLIDFGANSDCSPAPSIYWRSSQYGFGMESIDALSVNN